MHDVYIYIHDVCMFIYIYIYIYKHEVFSACLLQTQIFSDQHFYGTVMKTLWYTGVGGIID